MEKKFKASPKLNVSFHNIYISDILQCSIGSELAFLSSFVPFCFISEHPYMGYAFFLFLNMPQPCPTLCDPMDHRVHGILQARILEWVAFPFSRGLPNPGIKPRSHTLQVDSLPAEPQGKPQDTGVDSLSLHIMEQTWRDSFITLNTLVDLHQ